MSVWLSHCLTMRQLECLTFRLSDCLTVWLSDCLSVWLSDCLTVWQSDCLTPQKAPTGGVTAPVRLLLLTSPPSTLHEVRPPPQSIYSLKEVLDTEKGGIDSTEEKKNKQLWHGLSKIYDILAFILAFSLYLPNFQSLQKWTLQYLATHWIPFFLVVFMNFSVIVS